MPKDSVVTWDKATIVPLHYVSWDFQLPTSPLTIIESVTVENVQAVLAPANFSLWHDYLSPRDREDLASAKWALVHRFQSIEHVGKREAESQDLLYKLFLCLRLIKPTKATFAAVQFKYDEGHNADVFSFTHPTHFHPNAPETDALNNIALHDIDQLRLLAGPFLELAEKGPENIRRASRYYDTGFSQVRDPIVQIVLWTMGIEAVLSRDDESISKPELLSRIDSKVGFDSDVLSGSDVREYLKGESLTVGSVVEDLFSLRDLFVHGKWIPREWQSRPGRVSIGGAPMAYADTLREAASFILRKSILYSLTQLMHTK